jgi:hypothetical protein
MSVIASKYFSEWEKILLEFSGIEIFAGLKIGMNVCNLFPCYGSGFH